MSASFRVIGHRGACGHAPENTLASFAAALTLGSSWVEFDVRVSRDGIPVVVHDRTLWRTARSPRVVALSRAHKLASFNVPPLVDVLSLLNGRVQGVYVEIKSAPDARVVGAIIQQANRSFTQGALVFSSFSPRVLELARQVDASAQLQWLFDDDASSSAREIARGIARMGVSQLGVSKALARVPVERSAFDHGLPVHVFTVNDPHVAAELEGAGYSGVFTDFPGIVGAAVSAA